MNDLDTQIRSLIGELLDAAPVLPPFPNPAKPPMPRRGGRHRGPFIAAFIVASAVAVGVLATTLATRHPARVAVEPSKHLTVADVTFAIFDRAPTPADALPRLTLQNYQGEGIWMDPSVGSRLAIHTPRHEIYLVKACALPLTGRRGSCPAPSLRYCIEVLDFINGEQTGSGGGCTTPSALLQLGGSWQTNSGTNDPVATAGFVPDFVSRVTYDGRNVPIINNAFVMDGVTLIHPPIITRSGP